MIEYEACYAFTPDGADERAPRPTKRRRTARASSPDAQDRGPPFVPLLRGVERLESIKARYASFEKAWQPKQILINKFIHSANADTFQEVVSFIQDEDAANFNGKICTGLVVSGPDSSGSSELFESIGKSVNAQERAISIALSSGQSPNLKTILKYINQHATSQTMALDEETAMNGSKDGRQLNYDLQILFDYVQTHAIKKVILSFQDSEAFDAQLLADLTEVLSSWIDRIPFILLFSIATSVDLFQEKLSRDTIRRLQGALFHIDTIDTEDIFRAIHCGRSDLLLGPGLSRTILQHSRDYVQSPFSFTQTLKYAYMTHFFANPLSTLLNADIESPPLQKEHYEAIRNLSSFKKYAQDLIQEKQFETVRELLNDDEGLHECVVAELDDNRRALREIFSATDLLLRMQSCPTCKTNASWSEMYIQAMSGQLAGSAILEEIFSSFKKLPSDMMEQLLHDLAEAAPTSDLVEIVNEIQPLISNLEDSKPLRSQYDVHHETLRTTVVAQKVSLSKNTSVLSPEDVVYTKIVDRACAELLDYFQKTLINPQDLFLSEVLMYDLKSPHREVFTPRPRFAIERALSSPHDYLGCDCCGGADGGLSATQPATAILYQLYLESGSLINAADLWSAFGTIVGVEGTEDEDVEQQKALALFSRALADLKHLGMIKNSKKKADHLAKLAWKGL